MESIYELIQKTNQSSSVRSENNPTISEFGLPPDVMTSSSQDFNNLNNYLLSIKENQWFFNNIIENILQKIFIIADLKEQMNQDGLEDQINYVSKVSLNLNKMVTIVFTPSQKLKYKRNININNLVVNIRNKTNNSLESDSIVTFRIDQHSNLLTKKSPSFLQNSKTRLDALEKNKQNFLNQSIFSHQNVNVVLLDESSEDHRIERDNWIRNNISTINSITLTPMNKTKTK